MTRAADSRIALELLAAHALSKNYVQMDVNSACSPASSFLHSFYPGVQKPLPQMTKGQVCRKCSQGTLQTRFHQCLKLEKQNENHRKSMNIQHLKRLLRKRALYNPITCRCQRETSRIKRLTRSHKQKLQPVVVLPKRNSMNPHIPTGKDMLCTQTPKKDLALPGWSSMGAHLRRRFALSMFLRSALNTAQREKWPASFTDQTGR